MDFQMKMDIRKFSEKSQQSFGPVTVVVEGTVQHADVPDAVRMDGADALTDGIDRQGTDRFFSSTDTEGTGVETAACSFQLYKRFLPVEETALFRMGQTVETADTCQAVVAVLPVAVQVAESFDGIPLLGSVPYIEPLGEDFFSFSPEDTVYERMIPQKYFVVS